MKKKKKTNGKIPRVEFLHSGSHLLNLAASGKAKKGGWARGRIVNLVGDGSSGKTLLALEACAQAFYNLKKKKSKLFPPVENLNIVYDNVEGVMDFPVAEMYGDKFEKGVEWLQSDNVEKFGKTFHNKVKDLQEGDALIYVLDSLDALPSEAGRERVEKELRKKDGAKKEGTYGMDKQKYLSADFFNTLCKDIKGKDATLIIVSQVRDKINAGLFEDKTYRAGGKSLNFYTHQVCWLGVVKKLDREFRSQKRVYGVKVRGNFKRNKTAKPFRMATFDILFDYGVDDIGSMVEYYSKMVNLTPKGKKDMIKACDNDPVQLDGLIDAISKDWKEIEEEIKPDRERRFT